MVVGDGSGVVSFGIGRRRSAVGHQKAMRRPRTLIRVPMSGTSIPHPVLGTSARIGAAQARAGRHRHHRRRRGARGGGVRRDSQRVDQVQGSTTTTWCGRHLTLARLRIRDHCPPARQGPRSWWGVRHGTVEGDAGGVRSAAGAGLVLRRWDCASSALGGRGRHQVDSRHAAQVRHLVRVEAEAIVGNDVFE